VDLFADDDASRDRAGRGPRDPRVDATSLMRCSAQRRRYGYSDGAGAAKVSASQPRSLSA
jgi:hypothetical protein